MREEIFFFFLFYLGNWQLKDLKDAISNVDKLMLEEVAEERSDDEWSLASFATTT